MARQTYEFVVTNQPIIVNKTISERKKSVSVEKNTRRTPTPPPSKKDQFRGLKLQQKWLILTGHDL